MRIRAAARSCVVGLVVVTGALALGGPVTFRLWRDDGTCPACLCAKAVAATKTGTKASDFSGCLSGLKHSIDIVEVRIIAMRSGRALAVRAGASGQFSFKNVPNGDYVLLVTKDEKPLALRTIKVPLNAPIWLYVGPRPRPIIDGVEY
jgi:hypothetical protein